MPTTDRWILVDVPVEKAFEFVADYRNTTRYQKQFSRFQCLGEPTYGLGLTVDARGRFRGLPIRSTLRIVQFVKHELIVSKSVAHFKSTAEWRFTPVEGKTKIRFVASYDWPVPIPGRTLKRMIEAEIEAMTESSLRELKRLLESEAQAEPNPDRAPTAAPARGGRGLTPASTKSD